MKKLRFSLAAMWALVATLTFQAKATAPSNDSLSNSNANQVEDSNDLTPSEARKTLVNLLVAHKFYNRANAKAYVNTLSDEDIQTLVLSADSPYFKQMAGSGIYGGK